MHAVALESQILKVGLLFLSAVVRFGDALLQLLPVTIHRRMLMLPIAASTSNIVRGYSLICCLMSF